MRVVTGTEMKEIDRKAIDEHKTAGLTLMENAGKAVAQRANAVLAGVGTGSALVVAGPGNNGGDGFVAARHLSEIGHAVQVLVFGDEDDFKGDAAANLAKLKDTITPVFNPDEATLRDATEHAEVIIDALYGTGFKGQVPEPMKKVICAVNCSEAYVVAVDIPSGVDADTGRTGGATVEAEETVTFGLPKLGCILYPGAAFAGLLTTVDIGFPQEITGKAGHISIPSLKEMAVLLPPRGPESFKQSVGRVLVVAGSAGMSGAAAMCAVSALRAGAGIVTLAAPGSLIDILEIKLTEVMTASLSETLDRTLAVESANEVLEMVKDFDLLVMGPGLSGSVETYEAVRKIAAETPVPLVLDADALNALAGIPEVLAGRNAETIVTPHPGELARLTGGDAKSIQKDRLGAAGQAADKMNAVVVLKGARTVVAVHDKMISVNTTGNPGMATAGAGDVLAGMIGGLWAQHMDAFNAAVLSVYLHGLAGDLAAGEMTEYNLAATDLIEYMPDAFRTVIEADSEFPEV
jgi:ADP-dependent NAD(P)H-hydrate dehydratase / NAD(P)H-hydrate epimerase